MAKLTLSGHSVGEPQDDGLSKAAEVYRDIVSSFDEETGQVMGVGVDLPLPDVMKLVPEKFVDKSAPIDPAKKIFVIVPDLFEQLKKGKVVMRLQDIANCVPAALVFPEVYDDTDTLVNIPLMLVVSNVDPALLANPSAAKKRPLDFAGLKDPFKRAAKQAADQQAAKADEAAKAAPSATPTPASQVEPAKPAAPPPPPKPVDAPAKPVAPPPPPPPAAVTPPVPPKPVEEKPTFKLKPLGLKFTATPATPPLAEKPAPVSEPPIFKAPTPTPPPPPPPRPTVVEPPPQAVEAPPARPVPPPPRPTVKEMPPEPASIIPEPEVEEPVVAPPPPPPEPFQKMEEEPVPAPELSPVPEQQIPTTSEPEQIEEPLEEKEEEIAPPVAPPEPEAAAVVVEPEIAPEPELPPEPEAPAKEEVAPTVEPVAPPPEPKPVEEEEEEEEEPAPKKAPPEEPLPSFVHAEPPVRFEIPACPADRGDEPQVDEEYLRSLMEGPEGRSVGGIDANTSNETELTSVEGITANLAKAIIAYREQHGPFADVFDLKNVPGMSGSVFKQTTGMPYSSKKNHRGKKLAKLLKMPIGQICDIEAVAKAINKVGGVAGCVVCDREGLIVSDSSVGKAAEAVSAIAADLISNTVRNMKMVNLTEMDSISVSIEGRMFTMVRSGELYITVVHDSNRITGSKLNLIHNVARELEWALSRRIYVVSTTIADAAQPTEG